MITLVVRPLQIITIQINTEDLLLIIEVARHLSLVPVVIQNNKSNKWLGLASKEYLLNNSSEDHRLPLSTSWLHYLNSSWYILKVP